MKKQTKEVFINCPFDPDYQNHFNAIVFTLLFLDMEPRVAENKNAINDRISKIKSLVTECQYSIHDLSRIEINNGVPRFNMPFELGLDLGYAMKNKTKTILIFIHEISIIDDLISDLKGFDLSQHHNEVDDIIELIRNWLWHEVKTNTNVPSSSYISDRFIEFKDEWHDIHKRKQRKPKDIVKMSKSETIHDMQEWIAGFRSTEN